MAQLHSVRPTGGFEANLRLADGTIETFEDYRADGIDFELRTDGLLMAFTDQHNLDHHRGKLDLPGATSATRRC